MPGRVVDTFKAWAGAHLAEGGIAQLAEYGPGSVHDEGGGAEIEAVRQRSWVVVCIATRCPASEILHHQIFN